MRKTKGMSQKDVAYLLGIPHELIYMMELEDNRFDKNDYKKVIEALEGLNTPVHHKDTPIYSCELGVSSSDTITLPKRILDDLGISSKNTILPITDEDDKVTLEDSFAYNLRRCLND